MDNNSPQTTTTAAIRACRTARRIPTATGDIVTGTPVSVWPAPNGGGFVVVARGPRRVSEPMDWIAARLATRGGVGGSRFEVPVDRPGRETWYLSRGWKESACG